jgi:hypothetical protein
MSTLNVVYSILGIYKALGMTNEDILEFKTFHFENISNSEIIKNAKLKTFITPKTVII